MVSIHDRPADVLTRLLPGIFLASALSANRNPLGRRMRWEGDFVKGAGNASAIGTLVERKSRYTLIAKMKNCGAEAALEGFMRVLNRVPEQMRKSLAYDQGKEMAKHKVLTKRLKMPVYFCDPHSPILVDSGQRPTNENLNGLVRQYLPKGIDLSIYSQNDLDRIAHSLNTRPRAILGFQTPEEVFIRECENLGVALHS